MAVSTIPLDDESQRHPLGRGEFEVVWQQTERLVAALRTHFPANGSDRYVMGVAEEAGEFVGAYLRWSGQSRRTGTREEMAEELADVVVTVFAAAQVIGIDLRTAAVAKAQKMLARGFKEPRGREGGPVNGRKRSTVPTGRWRAADLADARAKTVGESSGQNHPHPDEFCPSGHE